MLMKRRVAQSLVGVAAGALIFAAGCTSSDRVTGRHDGYERFPTSGTPAPRAAAEPAPRSAPAAAPAPRAGNCANYQPATGPYMTATGLAFPTGDTATSAVLLHQVMPNEVRLNKPFAAEFHVTNITAGDLENVIVILENSSNLTIDSSTPAGIPQAGGMAWSVGSLASCETKVIKVTARSSQVGTASNCLTVTYSNVLCAGTQVVNPAITLTKTATPEALLCDNINLTFTVTNTGSGVAEGVTITDPLPQGMEGLDGKRELTLNVGDLAAGESKTLTVPVKATRAGRYSNTATASAQPDLTAKSETTTTVVTAPVLTITPTCEDFEYIGRNVDFQFTVRNTGDGVCANTTVTATIPAGTTFSKASEGGTASGSTVTWSLGTLNPGESRNISYIAVPGPNVNSVSSTATASCVCADAVTATCTTEVRGIPAILLEVVDVDDPVEVNTETTYVITVTNQGSAEDQDIRVTVNLPPELTYVSSTGPTQGTVSGQRITFAPLATLAPKARAEWRVQVRANAAADIRSAFEMTSKQFPSPVRETEATNLYD